jgi:hypothetical protein
MSDSASTQEREPSPAALEFPDFQQALVTAGARRYGRRAQLRRAAASISAVAVLGLVSLVVAAGIAGDDPETARDEWSAFKVSRYALEGELPTGWHLATRSLTPDLNDPREVLTAATFPLTAGESPCRNLPITAIAAMRPTDALVTVQERGRNVSLAGFPPRPEQFTATSSPGLTNVIERCMASPLAANVSWQSFSAEGRAFHALVVVGPAVTETAAQQAFAILDRLRVDGRFQPDWEAAG